MKTIQPNRPVLGAMMLLAASWCASPLQAQAFGGPGRAPPPAPNTNLAYQAWAPAPPMGWNSWDSYGAGVWQDDVLAVDQNSTNNPQLSSQSNHIVWVADVAGSSDKYVAIFNANPAPPAGQRGRRGGPTTAPSAQANPATNAALNQPASIAVSLADLGITAPVTVTDLWTYTDLGTMSGQIAATVNPHGAVLYRIHPRN